MKHYLFSIRIWCSVLSYSYKREYTIHVHPIREKYTRNTPNSTPTHTPPENQIIIKSNLLTN